MLNKKKANFERKEMHIFKNWYTFSLEGKILQDKDVIWYERGTGQLRRPFK